MKLRLFALAHGRSGDKGNSVNIGIIARRGEWYEFIRTELTADRVADYLKPLAGGPVERYELPNLGALNFVVRNALDGGGSVSMKLDAQGKTYAQALLKFPLPIDRALFNSLQSHWGGEIPGECVI